MMLASPQRDPPVAPGVPAVAASAAARCVHGRVLKRVRLKRLSAHLESPAVRSDAGIPTAVCLGQVIAVGTSHGSILLFDFGQQLRGTLGSASFGVEHGAVTAIALLTTTGECLAAGYETGSVALWDLPSGRLVKVVKDGHEHAGPITAVEFGDLQGQVLVASDARGSVCVHTFRRVVGMVMTESRLLLNGHKSPVLAMSALVPRASPPAPQGSPVALAPSLPNALVASCLLAFATADRILIVRMQPRIEIVHTIVRPSGDVFDANPQPMGANGAQHTVIPCVSWGVTWPQDGADESGNGRAILAYSWSAKLRLLQVSCDEADGDVPRVDVQPRIAFDCTSGCIMAADWLGPYAVLLIDQFETAVLVDPYSGEQLDETNIADVGLAYRPVHVGGARGRIERMYRSAISSQRGRTVLLGVSSCHVATVASWQERIGGLVAEGCFLEALSLALAIHDGRARAVIGLPPDPAARREIVARQITDLLIAYVDISIAAHNAVADAVQRDERSSAQANATFYAGLAAVCLDYCLVLDCMDVLFGDLYERFAASEVGMNAFLETLEPHVLADRVPRLTPVIMKDLVTQYSARGWLSRVEQCILHLDPAALDLHEVITLAIQHNLHSAFIYVHNRAMADYVTPLGHLLGLAVAQTSATRATDKPHPSQSQSSMYSGSHEHGAPTLAPSDGANAGAQRTQEEGDGSVGYKLLLYISLCLTGRAYPSGIIPPDVAESVKADVYGFLLARYDTVLGYRAKGPKGAGRESSPTYPHLRALLEFDAREFLNVLSLAFEDPLLDNPMRRTRSLGRVGVDTPESPASVASAPPSRKAKGSPQVDRRPGRMTQSASALPDAHDGEEEAAKVVPAIPDRQLMVDILLDVVRAERESNKRVGGDIEAAFFVFLARHLSRHSDHVRVAREVFEHMLEVLMAPDKYVSRKSPSAAATPDRGSGRHSSMHRQAAVRGGAVVTHAERQEAVLELYHAGLLKHIDEEQLLLTAEAAGFFQVVELVYARRGQHARILTCYIRDPARCGRSFAYAHRVATDRATYSERDREEIRELCMTHIRDLATIDARAAARLFAVDFGDDISTVVFGGLAGDGDVAQLRFEFLRGVFEPRQPSKGPRQLIPQSDALHEEYIALMCMFAPQHVYVYLRDHEGYRLEACLEICREHSVTDAQAWILERMGDIAGAFTLMLDALAAVLRDCIRRRDTDDAEVDGSKALMRGHVVLDAAIGLCKRNSPHMEEAERDDMWFSLLGTVVEIVREARLHGACTDVDALSAMTRTILNGMTGHVSLRTILQRVLSDETGYGMQTLGDVRDIVAGMLDTIQYEETLLLTTNRIVNHDRFVAVVNLRACRSKGVGPEALSCSLCASRPSTEREGGALALFACGHAFHPVCLGVRRTCPTCLARARTFNIRGRISNKGKERARDSDEGGLEAAISPTSSASVGTSIEHARNGGKGVRGRQIVPSPGVSMEERRLQALDRYMEAIASKSRASNNSPAQSAWASPRVVTRRDAMQSSERAVGVRLRTAPPRMAEE